MNATEIASVYLVNGDYYESDDLIGVRVGSIGRVFNTAIAELIVEVYRKEDGRAVRVIPWHAVANILFCVD